MVQRFPGKVSSNSEGCWISWMQTIQSKILEIPGAKLNKTSGKKKIRKLGYTSRACPLLWTFWKMLFHSLLEVAENSNQSFWLNGKRPGFYFVTRGWGEGGEWSAYLNCNVFIEDNLLEGCKDCRVYLNPKGYNSSLYNSPWPNTMWSWGKEEKFTVIPDELVQVGT